MIKLIANGQHVYIAPEAVVALEPDDNDTTAIHMAGGSIVRTRMTTDQVLQAIDAADPHQLSDVRPRLTFTADADPV